MDNFDKKNVEDFISMIREIVQDTVKQMHLNNEIYFDGVVVAKDENTTPTTYTVDIGENKLSNLVNKSGEDLEGKSGVRVYATSPSLTDAYIGRKLN